MLSSPCAARCTVLVNSCDGYADIWPAFFTLLARRWPNRPYPLALNTETLPPPDGVTALHSPGGLAWTRRLQYALRQLDTPFVLLLLDDFFLTAPVDTAEIERCLDRMQAQPDIACISFYPTTGNPPQSDLAGYQLRPQDGLYRFNAQAGLWRRERLLTFLDADEDAWTWENQGNRRSFSLPDRFYSRHPDATPVFAYDFMRHGLIGGQWFPETAALFSAEGIEMDFARRGFYDPDKWALLPSVASAFTLDSVLYPSSGAGFDAAAAVSCQTVQKSGPFDQVYPVAPHTLQLRWDPSTRRGFAVTQLTATLHDTLGHTAPLAVSGGNGVCTEVQGQKLWVFLEEDPQLVFALPRTWRKTGGSLQVAGVAVCPLTPQQLEAAQQTTQAPVTPKHKGVSGLWRRRKGGRS